MRLALSVGHGAMRKDGQVVPDPGAVHGSIGVTEYATCSRVYRILERMFEEYRGVTLLPVPVGVPPQDRVRYIQEAHRAERVDLALELHLNAFASSGPDGTETLFYPGSEPGRKWASRLQVALVEALALPDRGVKEGWFRQDPARGPLYFLSATPCPAVIVEPCFISNDSSAAAIVNGACVHDIAWGVFNGVVADA